ncbi:hypothetical protein F4821DRAFT_14660 [Hypoxylon rubiginosum]|uniref:Uncharacterized protein n=1 Tax=Hypoxylon rubiginosum TaxID=110542 RepID=A0ACC0CNQ9_9PEZI|nr:hypothetical protein F4821DRAFT_14660 [Hypoxylon rubiginosum]
MVEVPRRAWFLLQLLVARSPERNETFDIAINILVSRSFRVGWGTSRCREGSAEVAYPGLFSDGTQKYLGRGRGARANDGRLTQDEPRNSEINERFPSSYKSLFPTAATPDSCTRVDSWPRYNRAGIAARCQPSRALTLTIGIMFRTVAVFAAKPVALRDSLTLSLKISWLKVPWPEKKRTR